MSSLTILISKPMANVAAAQVMILRISIKTMKRRRSALFVVPERSVVNFHNATVIMVAIMITSMLRTTTDNPAIVSVSLSSTFSLSSTRMMGMMRMATIRIDTITRAHWNLFLVLAVFYFSSKTDFSV